LCNYLVQASNQKAAGQGFYYSTVPNTKTTVDKTQQTLIQQQAKIGATGQKSFEPDKCTYKNKMDLGELVKCVVAGLAAFLPFVSSLSLEVIIPFSLFLYFTNNEIDVDMETLRKISPYATSYENFVQNSQQSRCY
jgi:hypothetical protein